LIGSAWRIFDHARAQVPTAPQKQDDLYDNGSSGASTGEAGDDGLTKPQTSNPAP